MTAILGVMCGILVAGLVTVVLLQRAHNKKTTLKLANLQAELVTRDSALSAAMDSRATAIETEVEQRLIDHTRYCENVEKLLKDAFTAEEKKWRELVERIKAQFNAAIQAARKESGEKQAEIMSDVRKDLDKQLDNFRGLMDQAYLEQYEKMRRNPPRPTKRPRTKITPPERYRSLDDDFNCMPATPAKPEPEPETEAETAEAKPKPKSKVKKRVR